MNILNHHKEISSLFLCPVPLILPKATKSSEPEEELTPHLGFSRENSKPNRIRNTNSCEQRSPPAPSGPSGLRSLSAEACDYSSILDCKLFHTAPLGICPCPTGTLPCSPDPCFSSRLLLPMAASHSLPALHKWLFPRNALLLSGGL